jgi:two-component system chemotaxis response regulator CheB
MKNINVIVVDDSVLIRTMFAEILNSDPGITVVATAEDAYDARAKIKTFSPDVITLDIEMPKMDGISFLKKIMALRPMPVIMVSSLTQKGARATIQALEEGAIDYVPKSSSTSFDVEKLSKVLIEKVKLAAVAKVLSASESVPAFALLDAPVGGYNHNKIIAIGASTGGVEALTKILPMLPADCPPVVLVQHMPKNFTKSFAERINTKSIVTVVEAEDGMLIKSGHVYLAPGDQHLVVVSSGGVLKCRLTSNDLVSGHRPSADVLFKSVENIKKGNAVGVILTGMGKDGAEGLLAMKNAGAITLGQDEQTCVVYGMPKVAHLKGGVSRQVPIERMAREMLKSCT